FGLAARRPAALFATAAIVSVGILGYVASATRAPGQAEAAASEPTTVVARTAFTYDGVARPTVNTALLATEPAASVPVPAATSLPAARRPSDRASSPGRTRAGARVPSDEAPLEPAPPQVTLTDPFDRP